MTYILHSTIAIAIAFALDMLLGDPHRMPHIIRAVGWSISSLENHARMLHPRTPHGQKAAGVLFAVAIAGLWGGLALMALQLVYSLNVYAGIAVEAAICYQLLAAKSLKDESMKVYHSLKQGDLEQARRDVSMIVGRDTDALNEQGVTKAAVETVAENCSDGVIAPLFYMLLGGAVAGIVYKAVNTMDSMVGYKNERYKDFGWCAAQLDDVLNFIPARLAGLIMVAAAGLTGLDAANAMRIYKRDRRNHASPNSAHTEAACAGALNIQLAGDACYFGQLHQKPTIGDANRAVQAEDIRLANKLMYASAWIMLALVLAVRVIAILVVRGGGAIV